MNVASLATTANPTATVGSLLDALDQRLDQSIDSLSNNFGGGKLSANLTVSYDLPGRFKGFGVTVSSRYKSGAYTGAYEIRQGGVATGTLLDTVPLFGNSTLDFDGSLRYRTRFTWLRRTAVTIQLNVFNLLDESDPIVRRMRTAVIAPGAPAPAAADLIPSSYFIRTPRAWTLSSKFDF